MVPRLSLKMTALPNIPCFPSPVKFYLLSSWTTLSQVSLYSILLFAFPNPTHFGVNITFHMNPEVHIYIKTLSFPLLVSYHSAGLKWEEVVTWLWYTSIQQYF